MSGTGGPGSEELGRFKLYPGLLQASWLSEESSRPSESQLEDTEASGDEVDMALCQVCIDSSQLSDPGHVPSLSLATTPSRTVDEVRRWHL